MVATDGDLRSTRLKCALILRRRTKALRLAFDGNFERVAAFPATTTEAPRLRVSFTAAKALTLHSISD